jgi:hypothetical protein
MACLFTIPAVIHADWQSHTNISETPGYYSVNSSMDFDADGQIHMTYFDWESYYIRLFYARRINGQWQNYLLRGFNASSGRMSGPFMAITPDDVIHICYGIEHVVYEMTKPVEGGSWSAPVRIDEMNGIETWIYGLESDATGGLYFLYMHLFDENAGIYGRYKPLGGAWQPSELIRQSASDDISRPVGAWLSVHENTFYASYHWKDTKIGHYKMRLPDGTWQAEQVVANKAYKPRVAVAPDGSEIVLVYFYNQGRCDLDFTVFAKFSTDGGSTWTPEQAISESCWVSRDADVVYDIYNNVHILYQRSDYDGDDFDVWYRARIGGQWKPNTNMTNNPSRSGVPTNAVETRNGTLYLAYSDNPIDGYEDIYFTRTDQQIFADPAQLSPSAWVGELPADDTLAIANGGPGTISYTLGEEADWLDISSTGGTVGSTPDQIVLNYDVAGFPKGLYETTITISSPEAFNSPVLIPVRLEIQSVRPDMDSDGDVDMEDWAVIQNCLSGPFNTPAPQCSDALLDADDDVDADDVTIFKNCLSGANVPVDRNCD